MRIGIDARFYSSAFTGIGRYVYELVDHLLRIDEINHYVLFLNSPQFEEFVPPQLPNGGPGGRHARVEKILANSPHYSLAEQWHFWRLLEKAKLDLMHFTHFNAPILYWRPSIVTIHDLTLSLFPGKKMAGFWRRMAYSWTINSIVRRSRRVIAVSEHTKKDLVRLMKIKKEDVHVIHEGVNPQFHEIFDRGMIARFREKMNLTKPYLLYTGVWRSHKNLVNLIRAFTILKKKYNFDGLLVITGKEDPWYPEVKETVRKEHLEGQVRFTGLVPDEDLVLLYNGAFIYVLPSFYEGFGLPALEAMACGIPVCAARSSSLPEVCGEGNVEFFDPRNAEDIARAVAGIDKYKREDLRKRGFARVKDFSWEKMARETLALYNEILHPKVF